MPASLKPPKVLIAIIALTAGLLLQPARATQANSRQPVLIELFTSEGCSSCPPADRLLAELDRKQPVPGANIIVLSEHVDYWNYLGWSDPYSSHRWSERQSDYSRRFRLDEVYTPQMVVDGARQVNGSDTSAVRHAVEQSVSSSPGLAISISNAERANSTLNVIVSADAAPNSVLYAAIADDADRSSVNRGENDGLTLEHVAVLRSLQRIADLRKSLVDSSFVLPLQHSGVNRRLRLVLFAQDESTGRVLGVAERGF